MAETETPKWLPLAKRALEAAVVDDSTAMQDALWDILATHGLRYIQDMMLHWADSVPRPAGADSGPGEFQFYDLETGSLSSVDDAEPVSQWAGRLLVARWSGNDKQVTELFYGVADPMDMANYALMVLRMSGRLIKLLQRGEEESPLPVDENMPIWTRTAGQALNAEISGDLAVANELTLALVISVDSEIHSRVLQYWSAITVRVMALMCGEREIDWDRGGHSWVDDYLRAHLAEDEDTMLLVLGQQCGQMHAYGIITSFRRGCATRIRAQKESAGVATPGAETISN